MVLKYICKDHGIPCVILTGGGYASSSESTADLHADVFREAHRLLNELH